MTIAEMQDQLAAHPEGQAALLVQQTIGGLIEKKQLAAAATLDMGTLYTIYMAVKGEAKSSPLAASVEDALRIIDGYREALSS